MNRELEPACRINLFHQRRSSQPVIMKNDAQFYYNKGSITKHISYLNTLARRDWGKVELHEHFQAHGGLKPHPKIYTFDEIKNLVRYVTFPQHREFKYISLNREKAFATIEYLTTALFMLSYFKGVKRDHEAALHEFNTREDKMQSLLQKTAKLYQIVEQFISIYSFIHALNEEGRHGNEAVLEGSIHRLYQMLWQLLNHDSNHASAELPEDFKEAFRFNGECILQKIRQEEEGRD